MPEEDRGVKIVVHRGKWTAEWRENGRRRRASTGIDATPEGYDAAERKADTIRAQLDAPAGRTVRDVWRAYRASTRALHTYRMDTSWKALEPAFGDVDYDEITRVDCIRYAERRFAAGVKPGTVLRELAVLKAAIRRHAPNTSSVFEMPAAPPPRDRWLSRSEFQALLGAAAAEPHLVTFLHLAIATCARKEAVLTLRWSAVNLERTEQCPNGQITLVPKAGGKRRSPVIPMTRTLHQHLSAVRDRAHTDFVIEYARKPVLDVKWAFRSAARRAGLTDIRIHDLRHTGAVWMRMGGVSLEKICEVLGHSNLEITRKVYARYSPDYLADAVAQLELTPGSSVPGAAGQQANPCTKRTK